MRNPLRHRVFHAVRIGGHAADVLRSGTHGKVVSGFRHGVNALAKVDDRAALIAFQTADVAFHPWAVEIQPAVTPTASPLSNRASVDSPSSREPDNSRPTLTAVLLHDREGEVRIYLDTAAFLRLEIIPFDGEQADRARRLTPCLTERIHAALQGLPTGRERDIFNEQIESIVARFTEDSRSGSLMGLIGLGSGATPSGDDVLVGLLAALHAWKLHSLWASDLLRDLREQLPQIIFGTTTTLSAQIVAAACDGSFAEPLVQLCAAIASPEASHIEKSIGRVAALGHESGMRILQGFLLGWNRSTAR